MTYLIMSFLHSIKLFTGQIKIWTVLSLILVFISACERFVWQNAVLILDEKELSAPVLHGINKLELELNSMGYKVKKITTVADAKGDLIIAAGLASNNGEAAKQILALNHKLPAGFEALAVNKSKLAGKPLLLLCGSDDNGLMYALLDAARRISLSSSKTDILSLVNNITEKADLADRSISVYTMQRAYFESRLYDEEYWKQYFDQLALSRFNSFVLIFGYENGGFMAPPYPYFFNTDGFPDVRIPDMSPELQKKNTDSFNRMIALAHERGIRFTAGIWDHIYRGGVQSGGLGDKEGLDKPVPGLVWGVNSENLTSYNLKAIEKFIKVFPELDGIQFRMHAESGLTNEEMPAFWHEIFRQISSERPGLQIDLRAKELPDAIINDGIAQGLKIRVTTKYWMEQMGLPFHPTHVNPQNQMERRHGYADLLKYPQKYKVHWRLWNGGTSRILLWGDPEYARRFALSAHLFDGNSFEVNEPLATKMETSPQDEAPFELLNPEYRYYNYEFERYWYFFDVFGRITYNKNAPDDLWDAEFNKRFGSESGQQLRKGIHLASQVLPRIVASSYLYSYFPTTRGWAEKMHFDDLARFSKGGGTDVQQFISYEEEAQNILDGTDDPRTSVYETSRWFNAVADSILQCVKIAGGETGTTRNKELISTVTDLKILANLSRYYSHRIIAAVHYNLYLKTQNLIEFDNAISYEKLAVDSWQGIVNAAGDLYAKDLKMGICRLKMCGDWKTDLEQLKKEFTGLNEFRSKLDLEPANDKVQIRHVPLRRLKPGQELSLGANINSDNIKSVRCGIKSEQGDFRYLDMLPDGHRRYILKTRLAESSGQVSYFIEASDNRGNLASFPDEGSKKPVQVLISNDTIAPVAEIDRILTAPVGNALKVSAAVTDPSGIKWVRLRYRHLTQFEDYKTVEMKADKNNYSAEIPGAFIIPDWDIMYFVETMDNAGNGKQYPDFRIEAPYVIVKLERN